MMVLLLFMTCCILICVTTEGRHPDVNVSGLVEIDSFRIVWETSDIPVNTEFLTHERTYCRLGGHSGECKPYNYTVFDRKVLITTAGLPVTDRDYGCEMIFTTEDNTYLVYSSGSFSHRVFRPKRVHTIPIGIKKADTINEKQRESDTDMIIPLIVVAVYAMFITCVVSTKRFRQQLHLTTKSTISI